VSYHPSIPQATDDPSISQGQLLDNFGKLNTDFAVNHVAFTAGGNNGFHKLVQFTNVLAADPSVSGVQSAVYTKTVNSAPQLFFNNSTNVYPLTGLAFVNGTITAVVTGADTMVTSNGHNLSTGNTVVISGVNGVTGINGPTFTITVVDANNFNLNAATTGAYINGGTYVSPDSTQYGFITPWGWTINMGGFATTTFSGTQYFSIPYPVDFNTYTALLTPFNAAAQQYGVFSVNQTNFTWGASVKPAFYYYLVIGSS